MVQTLTIRLNLQCVGGGQIWISKRSLWWTSNMSSYIYLLQNVHRSSEKSELLLERHQHIERRIFFSEIFVILCSWNSLEISEREEKILQLLWQCIVQDQCNRYFHENPMIGLYRKSCIMVNVCFLWTEYFFTLIYSRL